MNCVILQPSYIPWRGYFHQIQKADLFVFYDDVQFDKRGWRNRNRIKTSTGLRWLTIPVHSHGAQTEHIPIHQIPIMWDSQHPWSADHWKSLEYAYRKAPFFARYESKLAPYFTRRDEFLADFVIDLTVELARALGNEHTRFMRSSELQANGQKTERLIDVLTRVGATHYISGPSAQDYIDEALFRQAGISLEYMQYDYPEYPQLYPPYEGQVSILDLLFMVGPDAPKYIQNEEK
jgi:hypothetical protein